MPATLLAVHFAGFVVPFLFLGFSWYEDLPPTMVKHAFLVKSMVLLCSLVPMVGASASRDCIQPPLPEAPITLLQSGAGGGAAALNDLVLAESVGILCALVLQQHQQQEEGDSGRMPVYKSVHVACGWKQPTGACRRPQPPVAAGPWPCGSAT